MVPWRVNIVGLSLPSASAVLARFKADASSSSARMYNTSCSILRWPSPTNTAEPVSDARATTVPAVEPAQHTSSTNTDSASGELRERAIWMIDELRSRTNSNFNNSSLCSRCTHNNTRHHRLAIDTHRHSHASQVGRLYTQTHRFLHTVHSTYVNAPNSIFPVANILANSVQSKNVKIVHHFWLNFHCACAIHEFCVSEKNFI